MPDGRQSPISTTSRAVDYDVIVIGAGISGLACADILRQHFPNSRLKVLEARDRIGGRINSVHKNGCRLDTGANWIHGIGTKEKPNPLMGIVPAKRYRQIGGGVMFRAPSKDDEVGEKDDLMIPPTQLSKLMTAMWGIIGELHELSSETPPEKAKTATLLEAIQDSEMFQGAFAELPEIYHSTLRGVPQFIENMEAAPLVASSAEAHYTRPGVSLLEYAIDDFDGEQVFLLDGYTPVIEDLARLLQQAGIIETNSEVKSIDWSGSSVRVNTSQRSYNTKRVVVTIPLGVLKERHETLFHPPLPKEKLEAIENLGFGTLDKIFLLYSYAWWDEEPYSTFLKSYKRPNSNDDSSDDTIDTFMGFTTSLSGLSISPDAPPESGPRILSYINLYALTGFPVLGVFTSCTNALKIESMTDAEAGEFAHSTFTSWLPDCRPAPSKPTTVHVTRWANDEFSRGSYSHMITGVSEKAHREEFQTPVKSEAGAEVRFAGEHTSSNHFATAHGALISGWREAEAICREFEC